jgi:hypothetical protein
VWKEQIAELRLKHRAHGNVQVLLYTRSSFALWANQLFVKCTPLSMKKVLYTRCSRAPALPCPRPRAIPRALDLCGCAGQPCKRGARFASGEALTRAAGCVRAAPQARLSGRLVQSVYTGSGGRRLRLWPAAARYFLVHCAHSRTNAAVTAGYAAMRSAARRHLRSDNQLP